MDFKKPWLKELYNLYTRDKEEYHRRTGKLGPEERKLFKDFCNHVRTLPSTAVSLASGLSPAHRHVAFSCASAFQVPQDEGSDVSIVFAR